LSKKRFTGINIDGLVGCSSEIQIQFFHKFASARRARSRIKRLKDDQDNWHEGSAYLNPMMSGYFAGFFTTKVEEPDRNLLDKVVPRAGVTRDE
jgi:hypothetical protein